MDLAGKVALVTGGARRMGRSISLGLARAGADIVVHYNDSAHDAATAVDEIVALGRRAHAVRADLASMPDLPRLIQETDRVFGRLDVLVNSAPRFDRAPLPDIREADWDRVLDVNLKAPFFLTQAAIPMLRTARGVVINIGDLSALQPWPSYAHHAVSKAGLIHLTRVLARALAPEIRANSVIPGTVLPPPGYDQDPGDGGEGWLTSRRGSPDDVVDAVLYLVGAGFVTGECLVVDGGRTLY